MPFTPIKGDRGEISLHYSRLYLDITKDAYGIMLFRMVLFFPFPRKVKILFYLPKTPTI
jgi:hypothetical protein